MKLRLIIIICILLSYLNFLNAQSIKVSLKECINIALEHHPAIKSTIEDKKKTIAEYRVAQSQNKILVNGELKTVEYLKDDANNDPNSVNIPGKDTTFGLFAGITATFNLVDPKKSNMENLSRLAVDMSKMMAFKKRSTIIYRVKDAYYSYVLARESMLLRDELKEKFKVKLEKAVKLFQNGQRPILDVSKAEVDLAEAKLEYERAKNSEKLAKTKLLASMGIIDDEIEVSPAKTEELPDLKYSLKELNKLAEFNYPDIRIAKINKEMNKIRIEVEKSSRYPRVDIFGSVGFENKLDNGDYSNDDSAWDRAVTFKDQMVAKGNWEPTIHAGLQAKVPILDRGGISGRVDASIAEYRISEYREREIFINMRSLLRAYTQAMNELKNQVEISALIIENAKRHMVLARKSYENGVGSQLDMQDAEMAVVRARLGLIKARYEYLRLLARLSNLVGIGEDFLCKE